MSGRQASLLVCDDLLVSMNGKLTLLGIYTSADITILAESTTIPQITFLFLIESDADDPFEKISVEVTLPGQPTARTEMPASALPSSPTPPGRTRRLYKLPLLIQGAILNPGRVDAKVVHENGEIAVVGPWIMLAPQAQSATSAAS
jgi:hypothetical protein